MGVAELLAEKDARARRRSAMASRAGTAAVWLVVSAGWLWTCYLAFVDTCGRNGYHDDCARQNSVVIRTGLITALVTVCWLYARAVRRIRQLEEDLDALRP
ncbi:hypothetical protein [Streptomyces sp. Y1]|uniref:Integral membrane protein n=1 Tax=Streptomyces sp. Y1 TaxID=3238634 RepID=A0AB39TMB4_9ACTN